MCACVYVRYVLLLSGHGPFGSLLKFISRIDFYIFHVSIIGRVKVLYCLFPLNLSYSGGALFLGCVQTFNNSWTRGCWRGNFFCYRRRQYGVCNFVCENCNFDFHVIGTFKGLIRRLYSGYKERARESVVASVWRVWRMSWILIESNRYLFPRVLGEKERIKKKGKERCFFVPQQYKGSSYSRCNNTRIMWL